jgi:hypothetical protein
MKKTILKTIFLTTVASLAMSGYVMAHHPSEENNPNFDEVDANINDMHNLMIDDYGRQRVHVRHDSRYR